MSDFVRPNELTSIPDHGGLFNDQFQDFPSDGNQMSLQPPTNVPDTSGGLSYPTNVPFLPDNNGLTQRLAAPVKSHDHFLSASCVLWDAFQRTPYPSNTLLEELAAEAELDRLQVSLWFDGENESRTSYHPPTPDRTRFYPLPNPSPNVELNQYPDRFLHATEVLRDAFLREPNPSKKEMWETSAEAGLFQYQVISWFRSARKFREKTSARARITPDLPRSSPPSTLTLNAEASQHRIPASSRSSIQPTTDFFAPGNSQKRKSRSRMNHPPKRKRQKNPSNTASTLDTNYSQDSSSSGASVKRQYPCLSCHEVFCKSEDWRSHQEECHFPKERWVCGNTHPRLSSVHPFTRKDNFRTHLRSPYHNINEAQELERAVSNGTINFTGLFHDKCGFCSQDLDSRDASLEHILADIEKGYQLSDWTHQCISPDHDIERHVRLRLGRQDSELDNDRFHDHDNDHRDFDGFNPDSGNNPGDGGDSFGSYDGQDNGDGSFYGGSGGGSSYQAMGHTRIAKGVAERECEGVRLASSPHSSERTTSLIDGQHSFKILRTLGRGGSAEVFEVSHNSKQSFALKVIRRKQFGLSNSPEQRAFNNEIQVMRTLRHPHIVEFLGSRIQADRFSLMSPVADMDLAKYLTTTREASSANAAPIDRSSLSRMCGSLSAALTVLHSSGWIHGDIKPSNILVFKNEPGDFTAKLSDFGCAALRPHHEEQIKVTPEYASPETILHGRKSRAADIWSFGCVLAEVLSFIANQSLSEFERLCFTDGDKSFHKNLGKIDQWVSMMDKEQERKACPDKPHSVPFDIIRKMLSKDPENRPTAREVWLRFPACTCCSECRAARYQSPYGRTKEDGGDLHPDQDWGPQDNASQIVDASAERCVAVCTTLPKDRDAAFSSTDHTLPSICSSPRLDSISTNPDEPKGSTRLGGLKSWSALYEPLLHEAVVDIVAIHGLGPYPGDTYARNDGKVQWLQDMVPKIPKARIFTYGYDAGMVWSDSTGLATATARDLLERLAYIRKDCPERPIVFVADKLGGTIVKKMLSLAKYDREYSGIYHATKGVVFLDTGQDSRYRRLDEEMLSRLAPDIECYNTRMSAAPIIVDIFEDNSTLTTSDEPTGAETESISKDHQCSTSTQPPSAMASACTDMEESNSIEANSGSSQVGTSTIYTTDPERIALWSKAIENCYRSVLMDIEKNKRGLGASEMVTSTSAITCN